MPTRFYFNSEDDHTELDPEGIELADMAHAQKEALGLLGRILQDATAMPFGKAKIGEFGSLTRQTARGMSFLISGYRRLSPPKGPLSPPGIASPRKFARGRFAAFFASSQA
jgi:hypothetical protein